MTPQEQNATIAVTIGWTNLASALYVCKKLEDAKVRGLKS